MLSFQSRVIDQLHSINKRSFLDFRDQRLGIAETKQLVTRKSTLDTRVITKRLTGGSTRIYLISLFCFPRYTLHTLKSTFPKQFPRSSSTSSWKYMTGYSSNHPDIDTMHFGIDGIAKIDDESLVEDKKGSSSSKIKE